MALSNRARKLVRTVIKQVHPDLFPSNPFERQSNTEALKVLNTYIDELSSSGSKVPKPAVVEFFIKGDGSSGELRRVEARLSSAGNLGPLFYAFGLITQEELSRDADGGLFGTGRGSSSAEDVNFLFWLRGQVQEAVKTAETHEMLKLQVRKLRSELEERHSLAGLTVGAEYAASILEQERQLEALKTMGDALNRIAKNTNLSFEGVSMQVYHPLLCPRESTAAYDERGTFTMQTQYMQAFVADDGCVHVVADEETMEEQLRSLDLERARTLTQAAYFWVRRVREVTPPVAELLGVRSVWCDTKTEATSMKFVLWAGFLLEMDREEIQRAINGRTFSFSVIVHTDPQAPLISFHQSSPILNVSADCPASHLLEFLASEAGGTASEAAKDVHAARAKEEALLESVRQALDAKCVIKICMNDRVLEAAQRLLDNAHIIRNTVDLTGACIALDDCYEVWDSGFISIPFDFKLQDLPDMVRMLKAGQRPSSNAANGSAPVAEAPKASKAKAGAGAARSARSGRARSNVATRAIRPASPTPSFPALVRGVAAAAVHMPVVRAVGRGAMFGRRLMPVARLGMGLA